MSSLRSMGDMRVVAGLVGGFLWATIAVAVGGSPEDVNGWVDRLDDPASRSAARDELLKLGREATPVLLSRTRDPSFTVRWEMANILGLMREGQGAGVLTENALEDESPHVRWRSLWALNTLSAAAQRESTALLRAALEHVDEHRRWNATVALSMLGDGTVVSRLHEGLLSRDAWRRWEAINALGRVHDEGTAEELRIVLAEGSERDRREAVLTLGHVGGDVSRELLAEALEDEAAAIRWRACKSLARIGAGDALDAVRRLSQEDPEEQVREHANRALRAAGRREAGRPHPEGE